MSTPMRTQYLEIKAQYPDTILLFRLGDFYETFDDDAEGNIAQSLRYCPDFPAMSGTAKAMPHGRRFHYHAAR